MLDMAMESNDKTAPDGHRNVKSLTVQFVISGTNIETRMHNRGINPQEAIGLLEMAKSQIMDGLKRKEVFNASKPAKK